MTSGDTKHARELPLLVSSVGWSWTQGAPHDFWIGTDDHGTRWIVKPRGAIKAARERAFAVIAQSLGISCQSSTFVELSSRSPPYRSGQCRTDLHSAILLLDEHPYSACSLDCPVEALLAEIDKAPVVETLRASSVTSAEDWARGEILGALCDMHEPPGVLFTTDHRFVQIDNELMFSSGAGADLLQLGWLATGAGVDLAVRLCQEVLDLPVIVFEEALSFPRGVEMVTDLRPELNQIRSRAQTFLEQRP